MKRLLLPVCSSLICAFAGTVLISSSAAGAPASGSASGATSIDASRQNGGHLIIRRSASFGTRLSLAVSIDGTQVAQVTQGRTYNGYLTPGSHVVSVIVSPNGQTSASKSIMIVQGQTYRFTAQPGGAEGIAL